MKEFTRYLKSEFDKDFPEISSGSNENLSEEDRKIKSDYYRNKWLNLLSQVTTERQLEICIDAIANIDITLNDNSILRRLGYKRCVNENTGQGREV